MQPSRTGSVAASTRDARVDPNANEPNARRAAWCVLAAITAWQVVVAAMVRIEYYDGYETLLNARYLIGDSPSYIPVRFPAMAALAAPAEALRASLELHPLDVRPAHITSGLLHILYAIGCWTLLARRYGANWATWLAFASSIPTYLYFTYAPFLSHDLAPGVGLLWMLILADKQLSEPRMLRWLGLGVLGAVCALVKPTFGLFWAVILAAFAITHITDSSGSREHPYRRGANLAAAAAASALLFWLVLAGSLAETIYAESPWWRRPWDQISLLAGQIEDLDASLWWVYLRNLPAFGVLAVIAIGPGLLLGLRGNRLERAAAISWILCVAAIQALPRHEVRYLAFLAPLTALLVTTPFRWWLGRGRAAQVAAFGALALTWIPSFPYSPARAALDFFEPPYRQDGIRWFLEPFDSTSPQSRLFFFADKVITVLPASPSPLAGDAFHQVFQFGPHHARILFGLDKPTAVGRPDKLREAPAFPPGSIVLWAQAPRLTANTGPHGPPQESRPDHQQWLARVVAVELRDLGGGRFATEENQSATLTPSGPAENRTWTLATEWLDPTAAPPFVWFAVQPEGFRQIASYPLSRESENRYRVDGLARLPKGRAWLSALRIERRLIGGARAPAAPPN